MIKMYKTYGWGNDIAEKNVIEITDKSVFYINERTGNKERELIETNHHVWHKSKEDAIEWLKMKWQQQIKRAEDSISIANKKILELELLK